MVTARSAPAVPSRIRIVVAGPQEIDRESLAALLARQAGFAVVGRAADSAATVRLCRALRPQVLILLGPLSDVAGVPVISAALAAAPRTRVLVIADRSHEECLVLNPPGRSRTPRWPDWTPCALGTDCLLLALGCGATGAIRRSASAKDFYRAVRVVASGAAWIEPGTAARLRDAVQGAGARDGLNGLTERELEVAALVADGGSNKEIARAVGISEQTVKKHVGRLLAQLELGDRLQLGLHFARHPELLHRAARPAAGSPRATVTAPGTLVAPSRGLVGDWRARSLLRR